MKSQIVIKEEFIKLDSLLKLSGLASTGGHAKILILNGEVKVNGEVCLQRGKKIYIDDTVEYNGNILTLKNAD